RVIGHGHRRSFKNNLSRLAQRVALQAAAADASHPATVVGDQHAGTRTPVGGTPDLHNRGQSRFTRTVVQLSICVNNASELFHTSGFSSYPPNSPANSEKTLPSSPCPEVTY